MIKRSRSVGINCYGMSSFAHWTIKSVRELGIVPDSDRGSRWCNRWRSMTKGVN